jgi:hypothetical protein
LGDPPGFNIDERRRLRGCRSKGKGRKGKRRNLAPLREAHTVRQREEEKEKRKRANLADLSGKKESHEIERRRICYTSEKRWH